MEVGRIEIGTCVGKESVFCSETVGHDEREAFRTLSFYVRGKWPEQTLSLIAPWPD